MTTYMSIASMQNYVLRHLSIDVGLEFGLVEKHTTANLVHTDRTTLGPPCDGKLICKHITSTWILSKIFTMSKSGN
jgi:hypothetical protein